MLLTMAVTMISMYELTGSVIRISEMHSKIMDDNVKNRQTMAQIGMYLDRHHALVNSIVLAENTESRDRYAAEEQILRERENALVIGFASAMKGGVREQLFHKVYSNYVSYLNNADTIMRFAQSGGKVTAYYNDSILMGFLEQIHGNIELLDNLMIEEIDLAQDRMQLMMDRSKFLCVLCVLVVAAMSMVCIFYSVRLSGTLDDYKAALEEELMEKNKALSEHDARLLRLQNSVIMGIATLIESRDMETGEHVQRTSDYVGLLAESARSAGLHSDVLDDEYIERLMRAAPLHDIGKIVVPDRILLKPGSLTKEEFDEMKKHAASGAAIADNIFGEIEDKEYLAMVKDVAGCHHEKWDGSGYPEGLSGESIPLSARIMAIADVFDALISKRHYKEAFPVDKAFGIIKDSAGTQFDPELAKIFLDQRGRIEEYLSKKSFYKSI